MPFSDEHGSVVDELMSRTSQEHHLFKQDYALVFDAYDQGLRGSHYHASSAPMRKDGKDGLVARKALQGQHAGINVIVQNVKDANNVLNTRVWTGQTGVTLSSHTSLQCSACITLTEAAMQVPTEVPSASTRVKKLMDSIKTKDPDVLATMDMVRNDDPGMRTDIEAAVTYILPKCPVAACNRNKSKVPAANILSAHAGGQGGGTGELGLGMGTTAVQFCYYKHHEFKQLSQEQKDELRECCAKQEGLSKRKGTGAKSSKKQKQGAKKKLKGMFSKGSE